MLGIRNKIDMHILNVEGLYFYLSGLTINYESSSRHFWCVLLWHRNNRLFGLWRFQDNKRIYLFQIHHFLFWLYPVVVVEDQYHLCSFGIWNLDLLSALASLYNVDVPNAYSSCNRLNFCQLIPANTTWVFWVISLSRCIVTTCQYFRLVNFQILRLKVSLSTLETDL